MTIILSHQDSTRLRTQEGMAVDQSHRLFHYGLRSTMTVSETDETRYHVLSRYLSGQRFSEAVRGHWAIESMTKLAKLDVNFTRV